MNTNPPAPSTQHILRYSPEEFAQKGEHPTFYSIERGKSYVLVQGLSNLSPKVSR